MNSLPPVDNRVRVVVLLTVLLAFCFVVIGIPAVVLVAPHQDVHYLLLFAIVATGTILAPLLRDLLGLPQRRTFSSFFDVIFQYLKKSAEHWKNKKKK